MCGTTSPDVIARMISMAMVPFEITPTSKALHTHVEDGEARDRIRARDRGARAASRHVVRPIARALMSYAEEDLHDRAGPFNDDPLCGLCGAGRGGNFLGADAPAHC